MSEIDDEPADPITGLKKSKYMMKTDFTALMDFVEKLKVDRKENLNVGIKELAEDCKIDYE